MSQAASQSGASAVERRPAPPTVVLTGASRGIGRATVRRFSAAGWRILSCSREDVPEAERGDPNWVAHFPTDLSDGASLEAFIANILDALGDAPLDALINNAAVSPKTAYQERLGSLNGDTAAWRRVYDLNFFAPLSLARGFAAALSRAEGSIVNITSIAGHAIHPFAGSAYATSKAALSALTREMAVEFAEIGVRVNAVAPGEIATEMIGPEYEALIPRIPLNRMGTADEVAAIVYRMCSDEFAYVTGTEIFVTGGQHLL